MSEATNHDTESVGAPMIRLNFREWELAPQFEPLKNVRGADFETCDTISPDSALLDRRGLQTHFPRKFLKAAFSNLDELRRAFGGGQLVFFHVFKGQPNMSLLKVLAHCLRDEPVLLLDVAQDGGMLRDTPVNGALSTGQVRLTPLVNLRGVGAWADGAVIGFEEQDAQVPAFVAATRQSRQAPK